MSTPHTMRLMAGTVPLPPALWADLECRFTDPAAILAGLERYTAHGPTFDAGIAATVHQAIYAEDYGWGDLALWADAIDRAAWAARFEH